MIKYKRKSVNSIYKSIIIAFSVILSLEFLFWGILYSKTEKVLEKIIYQYNEALIDGVAKKLDECRGDIDRFMNDLYENEVILNVLNSDTYNEEAARKTMYELQRQFPAEYITGTLLYLDEKDIVISGGKIMHSEEFFYNESFATEYDYAVWKKENLEGVQYKKYSSPLRLRFGNVERNIIYYSQTYPQESIKALKGRILILIDVDKLLDTVQVAKNIRDSKLVVLDQNRKIIMSNLYDEEVGGIARKMTASTSGIIESADGKSIGVYKRAHSGVGKWTCLSLISREKFMEELYLFRNILFVTFLIFLIIAGTFSVIMTNKVYSPIKKALEKLKDKKEYNLNGLNEIDIIMDRMENETRKKNEIDSRLYNHTQLGKKMVLLKLLKNQFEENKKEQLLNNFDINFEHDSFLVIGVDVKNCGVFCGEDKEKEEFFLFTAVSNIFNEMLEDLDFCSIHIAEDRLIIAVINFDSKRAEYVKEGLNELLYVFKDVVREKLEVILNVVISNTGKDVNSIPILYNNVLKVSGLEVEGDGVILFDDVKDIFSEKKIYYYPFDIENRLTNYIRSGDLDNINNELSELLLVNSGIGLSDDMKEKFCYTLLGTLLRTTANMNFCNDEIESILEDGIDFKNISLQACFEIIGKKYTHVCKLTENREITTSRGFLEECIEFVQDNYTDYNMGVFMIAEHFGVSRQKVFNAFKKELNISPSDYIVYIRIKAAKRLLRESRMNNAEIANSVGFSNDVSFVRVFKKIVGTTPKKFRDMKGD